MTKSELIARLAAKKKDLYLADIEAIVDTILDTLTDALVNGDRIELRGFGTFTVKHREARKARNPRTGEMVDVEEKVLPAFRAGKALRDKLNGEE